MHRWWHTKFKSVLYGNEVQFCCSSKRKTACARIVQAKSPRWDVLLSFPSFMCILNWASEHLFHCFGKFVTLANENCSVIESECTPRKAYHPGTARLNACQESISPEQDLLDRRILRRALCSWQKKNYSAEGCVILLMTCHHSLSPT